MKLVNSMKPVRILRLQIDRQNQICLSHSKLIKEQWAKATNITICRDKPLLLVKESLWWIVCWTKTISEMSTLSNNLCASAWMKAKWMSMMSISLIISLPWQVQKTEKDLVRTISSLILRWRKIILRLDSVILVIHTGARIKKIKGSNFSI